MRTAQDNDKSEGKDKSEDQGKGKGKDKKVVVSCAHCVDTVDGPDDLVECRTCASKVCSGQACYWLQMGVCRGCTPRLLAKALAKKNGGAWWRTTRGENDGEWRGEFIQDLTEAKYLEFNNDGTRATQTHKHTNTQKHRNTKTRSRRKRALSGCLGGITSLAPLGLPTPTPCRNRR